MVNAQRRSTRGEPHVHAGRRSRVGLVDNRGATLIVFAAFLSFVLSVVLWFTGSREEALFTGLWVPSILALGAFYAALQRCSA